MGQLPGGSEQGGGDPVSELLWGQGRQQRRGVSQRGHGLWRGDDLMIMITNHGNDDDTR